MVHVFLLRGEDSSMSSDEEMTDPFETLGHRSNHVDCGCVKNICGLCGESDPFGGHLHG